ncbi:MAG: monovalent cation/H+ antiporter subunit D family protein [Parvibaculaceae bacterium]|nr:monovalent cation/H+ antiporter subunit D family protein [Parvibaculaceae bacterium]
MTDHIALPLSILIPLIIGLFVHMFGDRPNQRDAVSLIGGIVTFIMVGWLLPEVMAGARPSASLFEMLPNVSLAFRVEPLGLMFALIASGLWVLTTLYAIGYMRANGETDQTRFYLFFAIAISSAIGIAFSANLLTLFIFYEALTLSTYPLVAHKGTDEARKGARTYLVILLGTSICFLLPAIIWTYGATGTLDFEPGGIVRGHLPPAFAPLLLALFAFGIGKAALMPFHRWLPAAMVAPTPVSALLHAVAVVKAGVFTMLKVGVYIFGTDYLAETGASVWLVWLAGFTILAASIIAMTKDDLKARLAYSTVSQLSYVTLGMALAVQSGVMGGAMQIAMHALGKITLFMCAGGIYVATHKTKVSELDGLGRRMPFTFAAFAIGALSIIGIPPTGGAWSKFYLMLATLDAHQQVLLIVLMASSLLNVIYLLSIPARAFFLPEAGTALRGFGTLKEAPLLCVLPPCLTAIGTIVLFFHADRIYWLIALIPTAGGHF